MWPALRPTSLFLRTGLNFNFALTSRNLTFKVLSTFPVCKSCWTSGLRSFSGIPVLRLKNLKELKSFPKPRTFSSSRGAVDEERRKLRIKSTLYYLAALGVVVVGASYAAVPLYRMFCASYSYGGTTSTHDKEMDLSGVKKIKDIEITIRFFADKSSSMQWNFRPQQSEIIVAPGETALAFYRAENRTPLPVDGISTYNVIPFEAGQYFNKIQCFCFEEQRLNPGETVELPVFFYIDPEFVNDPKMQNVRELSLSYTFFESKEMPGLNLNFGNWTPHARGGGGTGQSITRVEDSKTSSSRSSPISVSGPVAIAASS